MENTSDTYLLDPEYWSLLWDCWNIESVLQMSTGMDLHAKAEASVVRYITDTGSNFMEGLRALMEVAASTPHAGACRVLHWYFVEVACNHHPTPDGVDHTPEFSRYADSGWRDLKPVTKNFYQICNN